MGTTARTLLLAVAVSLLAISAVDAEPILTLDPMDGAIAGEPGATIGWGFTLTNPDDTYVVVTSADFCGGVISSPCETPLGTFTDFIAQFNFTALDPGGFLSAAFDPGNFMGIGSYTLYPGQSLEDVFVGQILLTYDVYASGPGSDLISSDNHLTTAASVSVIPAQAVPEPSTLGLLSVALALYALYAGASWRGARG